VYVIQEKSAISSTIHAYQSLILLCFTANF